jgi:hypothetical protein
VPSVSQAATGSNKNSRRAESIPGFVKGIKGNQSGVLLLSGIPTGECLMQTIPKIVALAIIAVLIAPATSFAQATNGAGSPAVTPNAGSAGAGTTGVSGIPAGPGSVGGNNNSITDPSGVGNASRVPAPNTTGRATGTPGH